MDILKENWKDWNVESSIDLDIKMVFVKFWTGRVPDADVNLFLSRFCTILQPAIKPLDKFGIWYGVRKYKIRTKKNSSGETVQIPNTMALGPYNGKITYSGQIPRCYICQGVDHQIKDCPEIKCWRCGGLGHKAKDSRFSSVCSLCAAEGHGFFTCPQSYANRARSGTQLLCIFKNEIEQNRFR
uniref:CCHC-type domain-containing protein n=1 Tax=Esox lucius TaxID=8010 RepID=A0A6Q2ZBY6_ESOLU